MHDKYSTNLEILPCKSEEVGGLGSGMGGRYEVESPVVKTLFGTGTSMKREWHNIERYPQRYKKDR